MLPLLEKLESKGTETGPATFDPKALHVLVAKDPPMMGFNLGEQWLLLDWRAFASMRIYLPNLGWLLKRFSIFRTDVEVDSPYLDAYFSNNRDNPYAVYNVFHRLKADESLDDLTQFPPLFTEKAEGNQASRSEELLSTARPGDILFSYCRTSRVSELIRKYDRSPWSHCAPVTSRLTLADVTTAGAVESEISEYLDGTYDLGLYRYSGISSSDALKVSKLAERDIGLEGYGWYTIFRLFLRNRYDIPYHLPSLADLIYSGKLELVAFY